MARWLVALGLLLAAPAVASARAPLISYVGSGGVLRLYDAETKADVEPPPPVTANFMGFRYALSQNGRYVVFNDAAKTLHLLDRATNSQRPLPGIDVYTNPGGLTVSDTGLIGFDDNGNGPAVVYDSARGAFVDTGLAANNGHRQTRLSADGRFLGTTCNDSNCVDDLDMGADPYVQDLAAKLDTGFPNDPNLDEEHPCINGDGSLFGFDKRRAAAQPYDVFLFDRRVSPPAAVDLGGANDPLKDETNCVLDASGQYVGLIYDQANTATFRVWDRSAAAFLPLPPGKEFDSRSLFSVPYEPPDLTRPVVRRFRMTHRRFRVHRRATAFKFRLSEQATVRIAVRRRGGRKVGVLRRAGLRAGAHTVPFSGRIRGRRLRPGRYLAVLTATDAAGNRSRKRSVRFTVTRAAGDRGL